MNVSIRSALAEGSQTLAASGVTEARREATSLLAHAIGRDRTFIIAHDDDVLSPEQMETFRALLERRAAGEPLQYITGHQEFFKLDFEVTPVVLIPRPETELIVEAVLDFPGQDAEFYFADIGTGSGCIAISILHELPRARAIATDISPQALEVARRNAERHGVSNRLHLIESDCFQAIELGETFDLIVSNPPYVSDEEMKSLQREVQREPHLALVAEGDGLSVILRLLGGAPQFLPTGGYFVFEIGFRQAGAVKELIDTNVWQLIEIRKDLQGIPRTVVLRKK